MSQRRNVDSLKRDDAVIMYDDAVIMYNEPGNAVALHPGTGSPRVAFMFRSRARIDHRDPDAARELLESLPSPARHFRAAEHRRFSD
jgi:hypothetical protein